MYPHKCILSEAEERLNFCKERQAHFCVAVCTLLIVSLSLFSRKKIIHSCCHPRVIFGECLINACSC